MSRKLAIALAALVTGCSTTNTMNGVMSSWQGAKLSDVMQQWGYPHSQFNVGARKVYVWERNVSVTMPTSTTTTGTVSSSGYFRANSQTSGGQTLHGNCRRMLQVDDAETVVSWSWEGNNCPFGEMGPYSNWRRK